jgi:hypothetical protein
MNASGGRRGWRSALAAGFRRGGSRADRMAYVLFAAVAVLWVAHCFYSSLRLQTLYVGLDPAHFHEQIRHLGSWSAPLDDVFIHFDFARSTARGHPFQWSEGNGYSSGGTSLLYPFVLAFGYWVGFRGLTLMLWAAIVACVCVLALLLGARRLFGDLPRWSSYVAPLALLCVGALDWTLFSGMEVALLLAVWAGALVAWDDLVRRRPDASAQSGPRSLNKQAWILGVWGAVLVATRPEAGVCVAVFSISAAIATWRRRGARGAWHVLGAAAVPGALVIGGQAIANWAFTGDAASAGALAKLELYDPYLTAAQVWSAWKFHAGYQVLRATQYHFSDVPIYGWIVWLLGAVPLFTRATRRYALLLWTSAAAWVLLVALNGQVRWQNERYTMPAVAWLLLAAGLGVAVLLSHGYARGRRGRWLRGFSVASALGAVGVFAIHQRPRFRDQVWFFGRASRNILEQHIRTGLVLSRVLLPPPHRVLVSDAGAIPYESDLPALDLIGLGGYHRLPFARATRWGVGAAVELIERMPPAQRPDVIATYPSWWGALTLWFGDRVAEVPVHGNVICGGPAQVIYRADWSSLDHSAEPFGLLPSEHVADELDVADIVDEKAHHYALSKKHVGYVTMKMLPDPLRPGRSLWDAGRITDVGVAQSFTLTGFRPRRRARLLFRVAPAEPERFAVSVNGRAVGEVELEPGDGWQEPVLELPADSVTGRVLSVRVTPLERSLTLYHLWAVQQR